MIIWIFTILLRPFAGPFGELLDALQRDGRRVPEEVAETPVVATALGGLMLLLTIVLIALAVYFGARRLLTRRQGPADEPEQGYADIERSIVLPTVPPIEPRTRVRRLGRPRDAVSAYLSTVAELERHGELARSPAETPAAHASRLRALTSCAGRTWHDLPPPTSWHATATARSAFSRTRGP